MSKANVRETRRNRGIVAHVLICAFGLYLVAAPVSVASAGSTAVEEKFIARAPIPFMSVGAFESVTNDSACADYALEDVNKDTYRFTAPITGHFAAVTAPFATEWDLHLRSLEGRNIDNSIYSNPEKVTAELEAGDQVDLVVCNWFAGYLPPEDSLDVTITMERAAGPRDLLPNLSMLPSAYSTVGGTYILDSADTGPAVTIDGCTTDERLREGAQRCLRYDFTLANKGTGPLELRYEVEGGALTAPGFQRVYRSDGSSYDRHVNDGEYHPTHFHYHYGNFFTTELWAAGSDGSTLGRSPAREGVKRGFCPGDTKRFQNDAEPGAYYSLGFCALSKVQPHDTNYTRVNGLSAGWADDYSHAVPDTYVETSGLPDGYYLIRSIVDPDETLVDSDRGDNITSVLIRIEGDEVRVVDPLPKRSTQTVNETFTARAPLGNATSGVACQGTEEGTSKATYMFIAPSDGIITASIERFFGNWDLAVLNASGEVLDHSSNPQKPVEGVAAGWAGAWEYLSTELQASDVVSIVACSHVGQPEVEVSLGFWERSAGSG